jgi:hypothetical protein
MLYISYQGIFDGNNFQDANTPNQIGKAFNAGFACMVDVWRVNNKLYLGSTQPTIEVSPEYLKGPKFWINARNIDMQNWISSQPIKLYPNYFWFLASTPPPPYTIASGGQYITPGTVPTNNQSIVFLPEIQDRALFSTVKLRCYGIISNYLSFVKRMRNEGVWY